MNEKKKVYGQWWFWLILIIFLIFVLPAIFKNSNPINSNNEYIIEISGTNGLQFSGSIGGAGNSRTIEGNVPATYKVIGWPAVAVIQKKEELGTLIVSIKENNKLLNSQSTTAAYGVVTVSSDNPSYIGEVQDSNPTISPQTQSEPEQKQEENVNRDSMFTNSLIKNIQNGVLFL